MPLPEYVRVTDRATGDRYSVVASAVDKSAHRVLKEPATRPDGTPLPPESHESLSSKKSDGQKAEPEKENS